MAEFNWKCPYCGHAQTVVRTRYEDKHFHIDNDSSVFGLVAGRVQTIVCANEDCKKMSLDFILYRRTELDYGEWQSLGPIQEWRLLPESLAKPQPDFIPEPIVDNYRQACRIRDLSPHASATMARRCLQGMVQDFCGIKKNTLAKQIDELRKQVDKGNASMGVHPDTVDAIDHVRSIGNIGAHMEKDINLVIDVDPGEAQTLIDLIELLFNEWYVARETRAKSLERLGVVAADKRAQKTQRKLAPPAEKLPAPEGKPAANNEDGEQKH